MTITVNLRKLLHKKTPEYCAQNSAGNTAAGAFIVSDKNDTVPGHDSAYYCGGVSAWWNYNADEDGWIQLPPSGATGTFAAGSCGEMRSVAAPGGVTTLTASAGGTTTTLPTSLTITRCLSGYELRIVDGPGSGHTSTIKCNTLGANAVITLETASPVAFTNATKYQMFTISAWFFNAGTTAVGFSVYDRATHTWTARSVTGLPTAWGTDAQLVSTSGRMSNSGAGFLSGDVVSATGTTVTTNKTFLLNQWANNQIRILTGTGAGQIRSIASNTVGASGVITVSAAWTTNPDATSTYRVEGNDDYFYLLGSNAVTMYRYSISANTWTTLAPVAARAGASGGGGTADWVDGVPSTLWNDESYGYHYLTTIVRQNGRYFFCFRGGASNILDVYDIAANTWISGIAYGGQQETFTTGSCSVDMDGKIYIQKEATGRIYRFDVARHVLEPFVFSPMPQGAAVVGDKMFFQTFREGDTKLLYLYSLGHTRAELTRWLVI